MKKLNIWLFCIALTIGLIACNSTNPDAQLTKDIVGAYEYSIWPEDEDDDDDNLYIRGFAELNADKTFTDQMIETMYFDIFDHNYPGFGKLEVKYSTSGTWSIRDSCILYNYAKDKTTIEIIEPEDVEDEEYLINYLRGIFFDVFVEQDSHRIFFEEGELLLKFDGMEKYMGKRGKTEQ